MKPVDGVDRIVWRWFSKMTTGKTWIGSSAPTTPQSHPLRFFHLSMRSAPTYHSELGLRKVAGLKKGIVFWIEILFMRPTRARRVARTKQQARRGKNERRRDLCVESYVVLYHENSRRMIEGRTDRKLLPLLGRSSRFWRHVALSTRQ